jgi:Zn-dependent protease
MSAIIHEYMHGWVADRMGDPTAKLSGRLTLNPAVHIDPFGSILLPLILVLTPNVGFVFGWAKPVPFNPYNLKDQRWGPAKVAAAGPLTNLFIAFVFGLLLRFLYASPQIMSAYAFAVPLLSIIVYINILLAVFNAVPIPPLDGSKIIAPLLPPSIEEKFLRLEQFGFILVLLFVMLGFQLILPVIGFLYNIAAGQGLF